VLEQGKLETVAPEAPLEEGAEVEVQLVEVGLHDPAAAVAKLDGYDVCVAGAAKLVGKKVKVRVGRVQPGAVYAELVDGAKRDTGAITAEGEAEKPTRAPAVKKTEPKPKVAKAPKAPTAKVAEVEKAEAAEVEEVATAEEEAKPKKKTRRGSRGGRRRKKPATPAAPASTSDDGAPTIHVPPPDLGEAAELAEVVAEEAATDNGAQPAAEKPRRKTRRGSRGGRNRRKKPATAAAETAPVDGENG
jgi:predicted RNA-binding protein with TRAM domain